MANAQTVEVADHIKNPQNVQPTHGVKSATETNVSAGNIPDGPPDANWTDDQLAAYAAGRIKSADEHQAKAIELDKLLQLAQRSTTVDYFRAGQALRVARDRHKPKRTWVDWQTKHGFDRKTVNNAIGIADGAKTEANASSHTLAEAKEKWGYSEAKHSAKRRAEAEAGKSTTPTVVDSTAGGPTDGKPLSVDPPTTRNRNVAPPKPEPTATSLPDQLRAVFQQIVLMAGRTPEPDERAPSLELLDEIEGEIVQMRRAWKPGRSGFVETAKKTVAA
jgi:hypothetical protein